MTAMTCDVLMDFGAGLVSVVADCLIKTPIHAFWGNMNYDPLTRVADTGTLTFELNNSIANSAKTMGYYSPANASVRSGFALEAPVVLKYSVSGSTAAKFKRFYISNIDPVPGPKGARSVAITALDFMNRLANQNMLKIPVQVNVRTDQALATIIAMMPTPPLLTSYQASPDVLPYVFDDILPNTAYLTAVQHLALTDAGYIFCAGNGTAGETFATNTRQWRQTQTSALTINADLEDISVPSEEVNILNDVTVSAFPAAIGGAAETVYQMSQELTIQPGMPLTFQANYTDPNAGAGSVSKVRVISTSGVTPVAGTDWKASYTSGGEAAQDANSKLGISVTWYAAYATCVLTNTSQKTIFVSPFILRAVIIRLYNQIDTRVLDPSTSNLAKYGDRVLNYSEYYQNNLNNATDMANHWQQAWHLPTNVPAFTQYKANRNATMAAGAVALDIGAHYTAVESVTGINTDYCIMGIGVTVEPGVIVTMKYYPEPVNLIPMFILDDSTYGVLDTGAGTLGF